MTSALPESTSRLWRTADLRAEGLTWRTIRDAVEAGTLIRVRMGAYAGVDCHPDCVAAGTIHGRLACVSELRRLGVFVRDRGPIHLHVEGTSSRLPKAPEGARVHRGRLARTPHPRAMSVEPFDAVVCAVMCQDPRSAVATIDSALHRGILRTDDVDELFAELPRRYRGLRGLIDGRAEAGSETFVRLMLRGLGRRVELQVRIDGVGRVDLLVDGWLIVECDSREFHSSPEAQLEDRRRDLAAAKRGYLVLRLLAEDVLWHPEEVLEALRGVLGQRCRGRVQDDR